MEWGSLGAHGCRLGLGRCYCHSHQPSRPRGHACLQSACRYELRTGPGITALTLALTLTQTLTLTLTLTLTRTIKLTLTLTLTLTLALTLTLNRCHFIAQSLLFLIMANGIVN